MTPTAYQKPEIRDANDNIIQQGSFGKNTALSNATNDGWIDYVANNLEALNNNKADANAYLPLTGGTMTGGIVVDFGGNFFRASNDNLQYILLGGSSGETNHGSKLMLSGKNHASGGNFVLQAGNDSGFKSLEGKPDGTLKWAGNNVITSAGGTFTGDVNGVTPSNSDNSTKMSTTAFVDNVFLSKIISKLQSTDALPSGTSFTSATILSKIISNMMTADGVQYNVNLQTGWYIKLGAKYGNFIIQGGMVDAESSTGRTGWGTQLPISSTILAIFPISVANNEITSYSRLRVNLSSSLASILVNAEAGQAKLGFIAICKPSS